MNFKAFIPPIVFSSEELLKLKREEVERIENQNISINEENKEILKHNYETKKSALIEIEEVLKKYGIKTKTYNFATSKYKTSALGREIEKAVNQGFYFIVPSLPRLFHNGTRNYLSYLNYYDTVKEALKIRDRVETERMRYLSVLFKLGEQYGFDPGDSQFEQNVIDQNRELWIAENYPDGTKMDCSCCDECGTWIVGEHRCTCGNRRVSLSVDGELNNWYAYAECN